MTVCFYHDFGRMIGVDVHKTFPMVVFTDLFTIWPRTTWKETSTLTADGCEMVQDGYDLYLVPHIPPPNPEAAMVAGLATATSSSKPFLARHSVTGEGSALACCSVACIGFNTNCWDSGVKSAPSGTVTSPTSVVTTPSVADYATAAVGLVLGNLLSLGMGKLLRLGELDTLPSVIVKHVLRRLPEIAKRFDDWFGPALGPILLGPLAAPSEAKRNASKAKKAAQSWAEAAGVGS